MSSDVTKVKYTLCQWCDLEYELTQEAERGHLACCSAFQSLPVAEVIDGKTFVESTLYPGIFYERERTQ